MNSLAHSNNQQSYKCNKKLNHFAGFDLTLLNSLKTEFPRERTYETINLTSHFINEKINR